MKILISDAFSPKFEEKLRVFGDVTNDQEHLSEAEVVLIRSKTKCTREYIDNAPNLKLIIRGGVGIDNIDTSYAATRNISVNNTPQASSIAVAELTFALMLAMPMLSRLGKSMLSMMVLILNTSHYLMLHH
jgi:phosphoglycerate dehydrogenase-like enzyme